jgi:hypothetical protein
LIRRASILVSFLPLVLVAGCDREEAPAEVKAAGGHPARPAPSKAAAMLRGTGAYEVVAVPDAGSLILTAVYAGETVPSPTPVPVVVDAAACAGKVFSENVLADPRTRGLRNVVIRLENIARGKAPAEKVAFDIRDCAFVPHVAVCTRGARVQVRNSDPVLHAPRFRLELETLFQHALAPDAEPPPPRPIAQAGTIEIRCDVHTWMRAYLIAHTSPYAGLTDELGKVEITGIPPGKHAYAAWHEELGEQTGEVTIEPGRRAEVRLEFRPPR